MRKILRPVRRLYTCLSIPAGIRAECGRDHSGELNPDPGSDRAVREGVSWLGRAQDNSSSHDGGVSHNFSPLKGWGPSYPETTGYIVTTILDYANTYREESVRNRARRMLDWLLSVQFWDGSFAGGVVGRRAPAPVAFNTGQVLLGLARGVREFGAEEYHEALCRAADWLVEVQDPDGCWRKYQSPSVVEGEKTYDTHLAWGLLEAARLAPERPYADAAVANIRWSLSRQYENGWFEQCCLTDPARPLTHTLGYALRGLIEGYRFTQDRKFLEASCRTADGLLAALREDGFLPGRLNAKWESAVSWACLTGSAQVACCWLILYVESGDRRYREGAFRVNQFLRRTLKIKGPLETRGAVKGSFPFDGGYNAYRYPNWACKFMVDANLLENAVGTCDASLRAGIHPVGRPLADLPGQAASLQYS